MPVAGRGEALGATKKPTWSAEEYGALAIFEVELSSLTDAQYYTLWHAVHSTHVEQGRDYNVVKLHETYTLRHYKDKSAKWCWISRPNNVPPKGAQQPNATQHTQEESRWFETLREKIRAAARKRNISLPWSLTTRVDSGRMCTCPSCAGTVKSRPQKAKVDDDGEVIEGPRREPRSKAPSKKRRATPKRALPVDKESDDDDGTYDEEYEDFMPASSSRVHSRSSTRRTRRSYGIEGMGEAGEESEGFDAASQYQFNDHQNEADNPQDEYSNVMAQFANLRNQFSDLPNQVFNLQNEIAFSRGENEVSETVAHNEDRQSGVVDYRDDSNAASIRLTEVQRASVHDILPMYHLGFTRHIHGNLMLRDDAEPIDVRDPVYKHGGPVMTMHTVSGQAYPFMVCDTAKCAVCSPTSNVHMPSPTGGQGHAFIHRRQCLHDEESNILIFAPEETYPYAPCQPGQAFGMREVVLSHESGPMRHAIAVCEMASCEECMMRELNQKPR